MGFSVQYTEQAEEDLNSILQYMNDELFSSQAAERFYKAVNKRLRLLCDNPRMYPLHHDEKLHAGEYHYAVIGNYLMFYTVDDECSIVSIIRIVYGGRDLSAVFLE